MFRGNKFEAQFEELNRQFEKLNGRAADSKKELFEFEKSLQKVAAAEAAVAASAANVTKELAHQQKAAAAFAAGEAEAQSLFNELAAELDAHGKSPREQLLGKLGGLTDDPFLLQAAKDLAARLDELDRQAEQEGVGKSLYESQAAGRRGFGGGGDRGFASRFAGLQQHYKNIAASVASGGSPEERAARAAEKAAQSNERAVRAAERTAEGVDKLVQAEKKRDDAFTRAPAIFGQ